MAAITATGMQNHLEELLSKTIALQSSEFVKDVGSMRRKLSPTMHARPNAEFIVEGEQFVRTLGRHVHEGLELVNIVQDYEFDALPARTQNVLRDWSRRCDDLSGLWKNKLEPNSDLSHQDSQRLYAICHEAAGSLTDLQTDMNMYSNRPVLETEVDDFEQVMPLDELAASHDVDPDSLGEHHDLNSDSLS